MKTGERAMKLMASAGMCEFMYWSLPSANAIHEFINAVTGWDTTIDEVLKTGRGLLICGMLSTFVKG